MLVDGLAGNCLDRGRALGTEQQLFAGRQARPWTMGHAAAVLRGPAVDKPDQLESLAGVAKFSSSWCTGGWRSQCHGAGAQD